MQRLCRVGIADQIARVGGKHHLELESVGLLTLGERESGGKVLGHGGTSLLDGGDDGLVEVLLVGHLGFGVSLLVGGVSEEALLGVDLGGLLLLEVSVVDLLVNLDVSDVDLGRGGDNVGLVDTSDGDTVDLERTSDEKKTGVELLQEYDALATETTSKEDEDGTGGDGRLELGGLVDLAVGLGDTGLLGGVEAGSLLGGDETLATVLGTLDLLLLVSGSLLLLLGSALALHELVTSLLLEVLGATLTGHVRGDGVTGHCVGLYAEGWVGSE